MNCKTKRLSHLGKLHTKYYKSGLNGNPAITDRELLKLKNLLSDVCSYMEDRGESSIVFCMRMELESIGRMLFYRGYEYGQENKKETIKTNQSSTC